jgi:hypothetical protein
MNFLTILSAMYGLFGAFFVVAAKLRLHLKVRSGKDKVRLGQFITQIDRQSTAVFIDILGFLLIGLSFSVSIIISTTHTLLRRARFARRQSRLSALVTGMLCT